MTIPLEIRVTNKTGSFAYSFVFAGTHVDMSGDTGTIGAPEGVKAKLRWWMTGNPRSKMTVEVLRDGNVIHSRVDAGIPDNAAGATDSFDIEES